MSIKYTPEILDRIIKTYEEKPSLATVDTLSKEFNIPRRSIISKLSALGLYQKQQYVDKTGSLPAKKEFFIEEIGELLDIDVPLLDSLEKCNKMTLRLIFDGINKLKMELQ